jgi:hypothetical protein
MEDELNSNLTARHSTVKEGELLGFLHYNKFRLQYSSLTLLNITCVIIKRPIDS